MTFGEKVTERTLSNSDIISIILKEINIFNHQGCIKLIKSDGKDPYNVAKYFCLK